MIFQKYSKQIFYSSIIALALVWAYLQNIKWLIISWTENANYSHGPLIPLISLYLVFSKRHEIAVANKNADNIGLIIILISLAIYFISLRAQINFIGSYSLILSLAGAIFLLFGIEIFRIIFFPVGYLIFMVPFWVGATDFIGNVLKLLSSIVVFNLFYLFEIPILREGVLLHLRNGSLEVADPCSGIRSLIALLAIGTLLAMYMNSSILKKVLLALSIIPIVFIANTIRVLFFGIVLELTGNIISEGFWHTMSGLIVFVMTLGTVIIVQRVLDNEK